LRFWERRLGAAFEIRFAPYNQVLQTLHDPSGEFVRNSSGLNVLLVRIEDLGQFRRRDAAARAQLERNVDDLAAALKEARGHFRAPVLLLLCPPSPDFLADAAGAAGRLRASLAPLRGIHLLDWDKIARLCPAPASHNPEGERLGRIPYTDRYFAALGTVVARWWDALSRPPYKVIAVDCDNTLWTGVCGEEGPAGVWLDPARKALHEFLLAQREAGMLLTMVSKNNLQDVLDTFAAHPEFPLRPEHFAAWRINWEPKAGNLAGLAAELNVALDSFVFLDDNPKECAEVAGAAPGVLTLVLPDAADRIPAWLGRVWAFDHAAVTEDDRRRNAYHQQGRAFAVAARTAGSLEDFVRGLDLAVDIAPLAPAHLARAAQLSQRTNQFNTTTLRLTEPELAALGGGVFTATVSDRFGDYGRTGLLIARCSGDELWIDNLLLSCRVLGRGVEHRLLRFAGRLAQEKGIARVAVLFRPSRRNAPAREFLDSIGALSREPDGEATIYRFDAAALSGLEWQPAAPPAAAAAAPPASAASSRRFGDYAAIAGSLATADQVLDAIRAAARAPLADAVGEDAPATDVERTLAAIWGELLHKSGIRRSDNFFDLGGHSLVAVLLLVRIKEELGVELAVDDIYSASLTLGEFARLVEAQRAGALSASEYEALVKEVESLSDEEVRALLEQEKQGAPPAA
jgi:FkbH-like protein